MTGRRAQRVKKEPTVAPGDDIVPVPQPVTEEPPHDRYCDLVLTGGVASGVVYPWAIVELARAYRFRNIGGTSVGAMAAALAAAAEYGRRTGFEAPFEVLRRAPASLAKEKNGRTRMLSLFQGNPYGERLIRLWGRVACGNPGGTLEERFRPRIDEMVKRAFLESCVIYRWHMTAGALIGALFGTWLALGLAWRSLPAWPFREIVIFAVMTLLGAVVAWIWAIWRDIRWGVIDNLYGLCKGAKVPHRRGHDERTGLTDWLHDGIQRSAGLELDDPPLTFRDLWCAPAHPGAERQSCGLDDPPSRRSINLQMITTNVTYGRPHRLPLDDSSSRLFFKPEELEGYFPAGVLEALKKASRPYAPRSEKSDDPPANEKTALGLLELPSEDLPVIVAARLSLSFPLLFSAVPLWAIDSEAPPRPNSKISRSERTLRRCLFTDGGVSSNFPIHLFDAALPRWPTFGFWLDRRPPYRYFDKSGGPADEAEQAVWLPKYSKSGRGDNWNRFDPESQPVPADPPPIDGKGLAQPSRLISRPMQASGSSKFHFQILLGFLGGVALSALDWRDRTSFRLSHVRLRVVRMMLLPGEGGLHIGMSRRQILEMAHRYGTKAGQEFVERFKDENGQPSSAWNEQRWVRFNLLVNGLRERLDGFATAATWSTNATPMREEIRKEAGDLGKVSKNIKQGDADALIDLIDELERVEGALRSTPQVYHDEPAPELRLRPPL